VKIGPELSGIVAGAVVVIGEEVIVNPLSNSFLDGLLAS
jgi:hypothetical protein